MGIEGKDEIIRIVEQHVAQLAEHFDSVQIFVTRQRGMDTQSYWGGVGNWYARMGQVAEFLSVQDARACERLLDDEED